MEQTNGYPVKLHIYDLSRGMARQLSAALLGKTFTVYLLLGTLGNNNEVQLDRIDNLTDSFLFFFFFSGMQLDGIW